MFKTVLVPIDMAHVAEGKLNLDMAAQYANSGAKVILLNVVEEIPGWAAAELPADLLENSREQIQTELKAIANSSGFKMDVEVRDGHSYKTILDVAKEKQADLIIIASHQPGLQDYLLLYGINSILYIMGFTAIFLAIAVIIRIRNITKGKAMSITSIVLGSGAVLIGVIYTLLIIFYFT